MNTDFFNYTDERFADIQMLRYRLNGFETLSIQQKKLIYYLSEATLWGRDITFDQFGRYNLRIRKLLEGVWKFYDGNRENKEFKALEVYLKRVWFSSGIYHHYDYHKFVPGFSEVFLREAMECVPLELLPISENDDSNGIDELCKELFPVIFDPDVLPKRLNQDNGADLVQTSACNYYQGVSQQQVELFYQGMKHADDGNLQPPSYGLNSRLIADGEGLKEIVWKADGLYGEAITKIVYWLEKAAQVSENESQRQYIKTLIKYYQGGDLKDFNQYCIEWVGEHDARVDFINGFIEVYSDPLGLKGSWEGIVEYKDLEATRRTQLISQNAQWFEDHSPVDERFKKKKVKGVTAHAICAAMLGGDEYPASAIGINLPNADWIRSEHGSKSVTISNLTEAYNKAAHGNGFKEEFVVDEQTIQLIERYGDVCDDLHTDLHECLGHGSGQLLPGVDPDALKAYGSTIEEARADLFGLYYIADEKLVELHFVPDVNAYKSQYYTYMMNGLFTQLIRIKPGHQIEEAHMRNRALIARWCLDKGSRSSIVEMKKRNGKTYVFVNDYQGLRKLFAELLAEVQRIKSEGDFEAARRLVEDYGVKVDNELHHEVLQRYERLHLAPYKGSLNPVFSAIKDKDGEIVDVKIDYTEEHSEQMLRYSRDYAALI